MNTTTTEQTASRSQNHANMNNESKARIAQIEVLTAEVRALMVGSRQVTLSVFRQLDYVPWDEIEPFGRVNDKNSDFSHEVVGRDPSNGALVRAHVRNLNEAPMKARWRITDDDMTKIRAGKNPWRNYYDPDLKVTDEQIEQVREWLVERDREILDWETLPLIVLAGLK
jgi:hypothetical protein